MSKIKYLLHLILFLSGLLLWSIPTTTIAYAQNDSRILTRNGVVDIDFTVMQVNEAPPITHIRAGSNVTSAQSEEWGPWTPLTDANGNIVEGGLIAGTGTLKNWLIADGLENLDTLVCIQMRDAQGNETPWNNYCVTVFWDTEPPIIKTLIINDGNPWSNTWEVPVFINVWDATGISTETGLLVSKDGGPLVPISGATCFFEPATRGYNCTVVATFSAQEDLSLSTFVFKVQDHYINETESVATTIRFTDNRPAGIVSISQVPQASNLVDVAINLVDNPSGISLVTIENVTTTPHNANKEILFSATDSWPFSWTTLRQNYLLTEKAGIVRVTITNRAGTSHSIYSNKVNANHVGLDTTTINRVVNPARYTQTSPFIPLHFGPNSTLELLPEAVVGGNVELTQTFFWDSQVTSVTGFYQFLLRSNTGYLKYETVQFGASDLSVNGNLASLVMRTTIGNDTPISRNNEETILSLRFEMYVSVSGVASPIPIFFPLRGEFFDIARVTGGIDESINIESRN